MVGDGFNLSDATLLKFSMQTFYQVIGEFNFLSFLITSMNLSIFLVFSNPALEI